MSIRTASTIGRPGRARMPLAALLATGGCLACLLAAPAVRGQPLEAPVPRDSLGQPLLEALHLDPETYTGAAFEADLERLRRLRADPVPVNEADVPALSRVPGLDPVLAARILRFRASYGPFTALEELLAVRGMSSARYRTARPYLRLRAPEAVPGRSGDGASDPGEETREPKDGTFRPGEGRGPTPARTDRPVRTTLMHRTDRRLDLGRGYRTDPGEGGYLGSPYRTVTRFRMEVADADVRTGASSHPLRPRLSRLGVTAEKDPGEPMRWRPEDRQFGFDHASGYLALSGGGVARGPSGGSNYFAGVSDRSPRPAYRLILGDYRLEAGQGLLFGGGYSPGKSGQHAGGRYAIRSGPTGYGSTAETGYHRGAALELRPVPSVRAWTFLSRLRRDGTPQEPAGEPDSVLTLRRSGLHRTVSEIRPRGALRETAYGGAVTWTRNTGGLELTGYRSHLDPPLTERPRLDRPDPFRGAIWKAVSLAGHLVLRSTYLYGELARGGRGRLAALGGMRAPVGGHAELMLHLRRYPISFWSPHGGAFGAQSGPPENEAGLFAGLRLEPSDHWRLQLYTDQFRFPGPRYGVPRPTSGHEEYVRADYQRGRDRALHVQIRSRSRESGRSVETDLGPVRTVGPERRESGRIQVSVPLHDRIRLRMRGSGVRAREPLDLVPSAATRFRESRGVSVFSDLRIRPARSLRIDVRGTWFRTDGYGSRIYHFENDLYYAFSVPALFGRGHRGYLLAAWSPLAGLTLEAKYAVTLVRDRSRLGSGWEELEGNRRREVRFQVRWTGRW